MTDSDCVARIRETLEGRKSQSRRDGEPAQIVAQRLAALPRACIPELRATAEQLIDALSNSDEGALNVVLTALTELRDPATAALLLHTLNDPHALLKEDYVSMLEDLDRSVAAAAGLHKVLEQGLTDSHRPDLAVTIRALHALRAGNALPLVARYVDHHDSSVRGAGMAFLYDLDETGEIAGPRFADQLNREQDSARIEQLIDGLSRWDRIADVTILRRIANDASHPRSLLDSARRAMSYLHGDDT